MSESKVKHTPGPWSNNGEIMVDGEKMQLIYPLSLNNYRRTDIAYIVPANECAEANASLIAAAPDLFACLQALISQHEAEDWPIENDYDFSKARAAIAKAEGERE